MGCISAYRVYIRLWGVYPPMGCIIRLWGVYPPMGCISAQIATINLEKATTWSLLLGTSIGYTQNQKTKFHIPMSSSSQMTNTLSL